MRQATMEAALEVNLLDQVNETTENPLSGKISDKEIMKMLRVIVKVTTLERDHEETLVELTKTMDQAENIDNEAETDDDWRVDSSYNHYSGGGNSSRGSGRDRGRDQGSR
jgi:hypothetical protein